MRLIDADALAECPISKGERNYRTYNLDDAYEDGYYNAMADIRNAPSIDIVRCRECRYWHSGECWGIPYRGDYDTSIDTKADDFCSYGERKER